MIRLEPVEYHLGHVGRERAISELFVTTFTASEGADEGAIIGELVENLMDKTPGDDLLVFSAYEGQTLVGCIFFSRLYYEQDKRLVFILSPVAVKTERQGQGVGQKLIAHGLEELRKRRVDFAITYGDPNYYSKVGFAQITEAFAQAPLKLNQPHGWLGQSLGGDGGEPLVGPSRCVEALNKAELW